jgi:hypothetical protein
MLLNINCLKSIHFQIYTNLPFYIFTDSANLDRFENKNSYFCQSFSNNNK